MSYKKIMNKTKKVDGLFTRTTGIDFFSSKDEDMVNSPPHYNKHGIECIDAIQASMSDIEFCGYLKGNVQKYVWRYGYKGKKLEDLGKAKWYLARLEQEIEKQDGNTS